MPKVEVIPVEGIPEVGKGSQLASLILRAIGRSGERLADGDVIAVKQKIISKSEGGIVRLASVKPGKRAIEMAAREGKDPRLVELILSESEEVVREGHGVIITRTRHGFVCANSGVDRSNVRRGFAALLPRKPDESARRLRGDLERATGKSLAVIVTDTFGRPWRKGQTDVAIGCSGIAPLLSYRGKRDPGGYELQVTEPAIVDELAGAAELVTGKLRGVPVAIIRGAEYQRGDGGVAGLILEAKKDLFR